MDHKGTINLINQSVQCLNSEETPQHIIRLIESACRVCYKSEHLITETSAIPLISNIIKKGHESVLEHATLSFRIITSRVIAQQLTRHRIAAYSMESTRYVNYSKERFGGTITFIKPYGYDQLDDSYKSLINVGFQEASFIYHTLIKDGVCKAEDARDMLPLAIKTEIVATWNIRTLRHILKLRLCNKHAQPQIRELMKLLFESIPADLMFLFADIKTE